MLLVSNISVKAQSTTSNKFTNKGKFFAYWGWNFSGYSNSDIHFKGNSYDFTLKNVKATDRQTKFSFKDYFNPSRITIPQTNFRIGYFFKENYTISIGVDHMKYVMVQNQNVAINGFVNVGNTIYDGVYRNNNIQLKEDFLTFEHTDGLNYINSQLYRFDDISHWFNLDLENLKINLTEGLGVGVLFPKTNTKLLENERYDKFHVAGYGTSMGVGLNITFLKHFFVQSDIKGGYIYMPDIRTTKNSNDVASQSFFFYQYNILLGGIFRL